MLIFTFLSGPILACAALQSYWGFTTMNLNCKVFQLFLVFCSKNLLRSKITIKIPLGILRSLRVSWAEVKNISHCLFQHFIPPMPCKSSHVVISVCLRCILPSDLSFCSFVWLLTRPWLLLKWHHTQQLLLLCNLTRNQLHLLLSHVSADFSHSTFSLPLYFFVIWVPFSFMTKVSKEVKRRP